MSPRHRPPPPTIVPKSRRISDQ
ncbi:hypothetical protein CCACVL1_14647 [Corchorus capsularis]|uniref:Uncharacterized protein n=1 Tax=Corchorus capsularis TaxID=210143 RepID=A0A1R3I6A9_COCAP|nr:hypothetical protein CCACVL1_14647 [Corchorus capsularis]